MSKVFNAKAAYESVTDILGMIQWLRDVNAEMHEEIENWTYTGSGDFRAKVAALDAWSEKQMSQMNDVCHLWTTLDYDRSMAVLNELKVRVDNHRTEVYETAARVAELGEQMRAL